MDFFQELSRILNESEPVIVGSSVLGLFYVPKLPK